MEPLGSRWIAEQKIGLPVDCKPFGATPIEAGVMMALWEGDAGYDDRDAARPGERHRLVMAPEGWRFECTLATLKGWER